MSKLFLIGIVVILAAIALAVGMFVFSGNDGSATGAVTGAEAEETGEPAEKASDGKPGEITEGMTKSEVTDLAGRPADKQTVTTPKGSTVEYWYYESGSDVYQIAFDNTDTVSNIRVY